MQSSYVISQTFLTSPVCSSCLKMVNCSCACYKTIRKISIRGLTNGKSQNYYTYALIFFNFAQYHMVIRYKVRFRLQIEGLFTYQKQSFLFRILLLKNAQQPTYNVHLLYIRLQLQSIQHAIQVHAAVLAQLLS